MAKKQDNTSEVFEGVEQSLTSVEQFLEKNKNTLLIVIGVAIVIVLGIYSVREYYIKPLEAEAQKEIFMAQKYLQQDSLNLALNGDGLNMGFLEVADNYGATKAGNLANYYAGVCYLNLGQFEDAIKYLDEFSGNDQVLRVLAKSGIGDAFMELGQPDDALDYYDEAISINDNQFVIPTILMKAGQVSEINGDYKKALSYYTRIKEDFKDSREASDIDKYIAKVNARLNSKDS